LEVLREVLPLFDWTGISLCPFLPRFDVLLLGYFAEGLIGDETQLLFARARTSALMLVPVLELGPGFGEGWLATMADQDGIVLPLHAVIRSEGWPLIHTATPALGIFEIPLEEDEAFAGVLSRSPIVVILMRADRLGQSVARAEEVDCARSAVIVARIAVLARSSGGSEL
jgi:hypothetical protein